MFKEPHSSLPAIVPKNGEQVFFLCVFRQQAVRKALFWMGKGARCRKHGKMQIVGTESGRGEAHTLQKQRKQRIIGPLEGAPVQEG